MDNPSTRFDKCEKASSILCCECSRISSITSDPVEKRSSSGVAAAGAASTAFVGSSGRAASRVVVVTTGLGGFELSSKPSMQTTEVSACFVSAHLVRTVLKFLINKAILDVAFCDGLAIVQKWHWIRIDGFIKAPS